jgi:hypothetical protein
MASIAMSTLCTSNAPRQPVVFSASVVGKPLDMDQ